MSTLKLPRLSKPHLLRSIAPERLAVLLQPHHEFFFTRGIQVATLDKSDAAGVERVIQCLLHPDRDTPLELLNAVCMIDEMASPQSIDLLLNEIPYAELGLATDGSHSAVDIAAAAWLQQRERLLHVHARCKLKNARAFEYFQNSHAQPPQFRMPPTETVRMLEADLDALFESRLRGRGTRVEIFPGDDEVELSIRHGSLFRREQSIDDGIIGTVAFRPVQCDAVIFNRQLGELRVNAKSATEKTWYCRLIGKHLFGDENCFPSGEKYSLEPLRQYGHASISPGDIDEIRQIRLVELSTYDGGDYSAWTIRKASDLFAWLAVLRKDIPAERKLARATFKMKLFGRRDERTITLRPPNVAIYSRGPEATIIEAWLEQRGFVVSKRSARRQTHAPILASA